MISIKAYKSPFAKCDNCESTESLFHIKFDTGTKKACSITTVVLCKSCMKLLKERL